jgi:hypothetical protein
MKLKTHNFVVVTLLMSAVALPAVAATNPTEFLGASAPPSAATQEIRINPETKYVNVEGGAVVTFIVGDKRFTWHFDGSRSVGSFDLNQVAPAGMLDRPVTVYIAPDPQWLGG